MRGLVEEMGELKRLITGVVYCRLRCNYMMKKQTLTLALLLLSVVAVGQNFPPFGRGIVHTTVLTGPTQFSSPWIVRSINYLPATDETEVVFYADTPRIPGNLGAGRLLMIIDMEPNSCSGRNYRMREVKQVIYHNPIMDSGVALFDGRFNTSIPDDGSLLEHVQMMIAVQYKDVVLDPGSSITCEPYNGRTGGVIMFYAKQLIFNGGVIDGTGKGYYATTDVEGGKPGTNNTGTPGIPGVDNGDAQDSFNNMLTPYYGLTGGLGQLRLCEKYVFPADTVYGGWTSSGIEGGNGSLMYSGNDGGAGGNFRCPCQANMYTQKLLLPGQSGKSGKGGRGPGAGGHGGAGGTAYPHHIIGPEQYGTAGENLDPDSCYGGRGGVGGAGGAIIYIRAEIVRNDNNHLAIRNNGLDGEDAQPSSCTGGRGGDGGDGKPAVNCEVPPSPNGYWHELSGGEGGPGQGGNGAEGGSGGGGGNAGIVYVVSNYNPVTHAYVEQIGGAGGVGTSGTQRGATGSGGSYVPNPMCFDCEYNPPPLPGASDTVVQFRKKEFSEPCACESVMTRLAYNSYSTGTSIGITNSDPLVTSIFDYRYDSTDSSNVMMVREETDTTVKSFYCRLYNVYGSNTYLKFKDHFINNLHDTAQSILHAGSSQSINFYHTNSTVTWIYYPFYLLGGDSAGYVVEVANDSTLWEENCYVESKDGKNGKDGEPGIGQDGPNNQNDALVSAVYIRDSPEPDSFLNDHTPPMPDDDDLAGDNDGEDVFRWEASPTALGIVITNQERQAIQGLLNIYTLHGQLLDSRTITIGRGSKLLLDVQWRNRPIVLQLGGKTQVVAPLR